MDRIDRNHPLTQAARESNMHAASHGIQHTIEEWAEMGVTIGELMYLAEQRAIRAVAAQAYGYDLGGDPTMVERDNFIAAMVQTEPRWGELKILLVSAYMDGMVIGWHGRDIALDRSQNPC